MSLEEIRRLLAEMRSRLSELTEELRSLDPDEGSDRATEIDHILRTAFEDGAERGLLDEIDRLVEKEQLMVRAEEAIAAGGEARGVRAESGAFSPPNINRNDDPFDMESMRVSPFDDRATVNRQLVGRAKTAVEKIDADDGARERMTEMLSKVDDAGVLAKRYLTTGSELYERAFSNYIAGKPAVGDEARALASGTDNKGGYAIPVQLDPTIILTSDGSVNPLRQISRVESITTNKWEGVTHGGVTTGYQEEADQARSGDEGTFAQVTVEPERASSWIPFSFEAEQDWGQMRQEMARLIAESKDDLEADKFVTGSGTNEPSGVVETLASASAVDTAGTGAFAVGDVYALELELEPRYRARAAVLANRAIYSDIRQFASSDGHDLWERIGAGLPPRLLGYPAYEASEMDATKTAGDEIMLFGDFRNFLIVDRVGMSVELVPHVFGANQRPTGQRGLYAFWRNSSKVLVDKAFALLTVKTGGD